MKKGIVFIFIIMVILLFTNHKKAIIVPSNSIRYRIIASSNEKEDQLTKERINTDILPIISSISRANTLNETRKLITDNIPNIEKILDKHNIEYSINYGSNYFPQKEYNEVIYPEGTYESLVITLGKAKGDNWWCVLFPPLCLMEAKKDSVDKITYTSYIKKIINKYI